MSDNTSIYGVNDSGEACMRVSENVTSNDPTSIYGVNENGEAAVRVMGVGGGGGGSDRHNLGWYATQSALEEAHATAEAGDFAIVGSTDTVWVWDTDSSSWKDTDQKGQVASVNGKTGAVTVSEVPSQTGNAGKFLTTDGTDASWSDKPLANLATGTSSLSIMGEATARPSSVVIGELAKGAASNGSACVAVGAQAKATGNGSTAIGKGSEAIDTECVAIGNGAHAYGIGSVQIKYGTNNTPNTVQIGSYTVMSADGTIPADRLVNSINKYTTMPTAGANNLGWIVQYTGATDSTYTHGYIYECVSNGENPATYSWTAVQVQAGGGSSLPSQTDNAGKFLTTDGTDASWSDKPLVNTNPTNTTSLLIGNAGGTVASIAQSAICITSMASYSGWISLGSSAIAIGTKNATGSYAINIGGSSCSGNYAIQLGTGGTNSDANTFKVANQNGNFEIMSADGTIPAARHASLPASDGTYVLKLVISGGVPTLSWVAE